MRSLLRFLPASARKWVLIGLALLLVGGILARFFSGAAVSKSVVIVGLVALLAIAALWILIHFATKASRKRKQHSFDASLAAKEGIEDRKREWQSWVQELEKQGIDRYELPFYLLLGEPQSGKSILLQNSDLHFLFGQNRLSGVGGTRGCDWWFTQEAVILDLAGRLFTHEGGAADEAEWESFLDLLNGFRPMDPANGIMLVIPCDSLLADSIETSRKKASQIREALFTLTRKLEAKLPIYVILSKGDKIFGFAESVHRLETEQRQQMFGWSRPLDRLEHPFQSEELGEAWDGFVESATSLRDSMLATARVPEAIPEVDRMMAFPSELRGMYLAVEAYMTRIFQGSDLLDQLYFRGIYLTSGLQSGAPIAKVGLEILDRPGDADNRDLETLFVRQQAYFIRDLVRRRVFAERGLVRPTGSRTKRVQKNARIGYGVAASFAVLAAGWCAISFVKSRKQAKRDVFSPAIAAGEYYAADKGLEELTEMSTQGNVLAALNRLDSVNEAIELSREAEDEFGRTEGLYESRTPELKRLDSTLKETLFYPRFQDTAAGALNQRFQAGSAQMSAPTFVRDAEAAAILKDGFKSSEEAALVLSVIPDNDTSEAAVKKLLKETLPEDATAEPCTDEALTQARAAIAQSWSGLTTTSSEICLEEPLRTFVVLFEVQQLREAIERWDVEVIDKNKVNAACEGLVSAIKVARETNGDTAGRSETKDVEEIREFLETTYPHLQEIRGRLRADDAPIDETRLDRFAAFLRKSMKSLSTEAGPGASIAELKEARREATDLVKNVALNEVISPSWEGGSETPSIDAFVEALSAGCEACKAPEGRDGPLPKEVVLARAKTRILASRFVSQNRDWETFQSHATDGTDAPETSWRTSSDALKDMEAPIAMLRANPAAGPMGISALSNHVQDLAEEGLGAGDALLDSETGSINTPLAKALLTHRKSFPNARSGEARDPVLKHAAGALSALDEQWTANAKDQTVQAGEIAKAALAHLEALDGLKGTDLDPLDETELLAHKTLVETRAEQAIDRELSKRLFESCKNLARDRARELRKYSPATGIETALVKLTGDGDPGVFDSWFEEVVASKGMDHANMILLSKLAAEMSPTNVAQQKLEGLVASCKKLTARSGNRNEDGLIKTLRGRLRDIAAIKSTSNRATELVALAEAKEVTESGMESVFVTTLREEMILNQMRVLKDEYHKALGKKIKREGVDLETLWGTMDEPTASRQLSALSSIFGGNQGWYPKLYSSFRLGTLKELELDFRGDLAGEEEEPSEEAEKLSTLDRFLEEMAIYLSDFDGDAVIDEDDNEQPMFMVSQPSDRLAFTLTPSRDFESSSKGGWRNFGGIESPQFIDGVQSVSAGGNPIFPTKPFESWTYGTIREIKMTLNPKSGSKLKKRTWRTSSPLAPLHFWWLAGSNNGDGKVLTEKEALFVIRLDDDLHVEFEISFVAPPPSRPRKRDTPLGD